VLSLGNARQATAAIDALDPVRRADVDLGLDEALSLALRSLGPPGGARRLVVVLSDGLNRSMKRDVFRGLGNRARQLRVPIHPIGFSSIDERGPLLNLGEIAKRSGGTMRWARMSTDIRGEFLNLAREIAEQQVLTFPMPSRCSAAHRVQITSGELTSQPLTAPAVSQQKISGRRWPVLLFVGGLVVAVGLLLVLARSLRPARRDGRAHPPAAPAPEASPVADAPRRPPRTQRGGAERRASALEAAVEALQAEALQAEAEAPDAGATWLIGVGPPVPELQARLSAGRTVVGCARDADIQLPVGAEVALHHVELLLDDDGLECVDIEGTGMVLVNGKPVDRAALSDGDSLQIGLVRLTVRRR
jgi:hypothetical protein